MKRNTETKMPVKEAFRLNWWAVCYWWKLYPSQFASTASSAIVTALKPYVLIWFTAQIINELAIGRDEKTLSQLVLGALLSAAVISLVEAAFTRWKDTCNAGNYIKGTRVLTDKLLSMDFCTVEDPHTYDLYSQIQQNNRWSGWGLGRIIRNFNDIVSSLGQILGAVALTASLFLFQVPETGGSLTILNHPLFVAALCALLLAVTLLTPALSNKAQGYWVSHKDDAKMNNRKFGFFGFMGYEAKRAADIRMYRQDIICNQYIHDDMGFGQQEIDAKGVVGLLKAASAAVAYLFTGLVYFFVCLKAYGGAFGVGSVTQYVGAVTSLSGGVSKFVETLGSMYNNAIFLKDVYEFIHIPNPMYQGSLTVEKRSDRRYEIEFQDVSFRYPSMEDTWALRHVSIKFKVGQRLAVVGQNGSGKTTFIKLLCRLYDPTEGTILLNGIDIRKYDYQEYLSVFSVVFQDFQLLAFPLGQNVAASNTVDKGKAESCLEEVGFHPRIENMPDGLDTYLYRDFNKKGVEISGGEAQKIAIARALYKDAPFIILDEPTAALDPIAEADIYSNFDKVVGDKTAIYISHRLSSCRFCDEILVFDQGGIVQQGSHENLVANQEGKYHQLWTAQAQYYANEA